MKHIGLAKVKKVKKLMIMPAYPIRVAGFFYVVRGVEGWVS